MCCFLSIYTIKQLLDFNMKTNLDPKFQLVVFSIDTYEDPSVWGREGPYHQHNSYEFFSVRDGSMSLFYQDEEGKEVELIVPPKEVLIISPYATHHTQVHPHLSTIKMEIAMADGTDIRSYLSSSPYVSCFSEASFYLKGSQKAIVFADNGKIDFQMEKMGAFAGPSNNWDEIKKAKFELLLKELFLEIISSHVVPSQFKQYNLPLKKALAYIEKNFYRPLSVEEIATAVGISASYLQNLFKDGIGRTVKKELQRVRIEKAKHMLTSTNYSIGTIAIRSGYQSVQDFNLNFKSITGKSPGEYKHNQYGENDAHYFSTPTGYNEKDYKKESKN